MDAHEAPYGRSAANAPLAADGASIAQRLAGFDYFNMTKTWAKSGTLSGPGWRFGSGYAGYQRHEVGSACTCRRGIGSILPLAAPVPPSGPRGGIEPHTARLCRPAAMLDLHPAANLCYAKEPSDIPAPGEE